MLDFFRAVPKSRKIKVKKGGGVLFNNPPLFKKTIFHAGSYLLVASVIYTIYLYIPLFGAWSNYRLRGGGNDVVLTRLLPKADISKDSLEIVADDQKSFRLQVPKILADSKVKANVNPYLAGEYLEVLEQEVVAHAKTSSLPGSGQGKSTYIFAHSTSQGLNMVRNNSVFYLLGELKEGDLAYVNYDEKVYIYKVYQKKVVKPSEIEYLNYQEEGKEVLILQTCWPIGTDWQRLLVFGERI